jgi:hypothetical protein
MRCSLPVVTAAVAVLALAGCGSSSGTSSSPASSPPLKSPADVQVCQHVKAYPAFTGAAGMKKYASFLSRQAKVPDVNQVLAEDLQASAEDLDAYVKGNASQAQVGADANKVKALCGAYGVS